MWYTGDLMNSDASTGLCAETAHLALAGRARSAERTLVVLGDSITYGWGLPYELSYPALLNRRLNEGVAGSWPWRVINAGVPGDTVLCAERRYERDVSRWQADVLIISLGLNDAALRRTGIDEQRERLWLAYRRPWVRWGLRLDRVLVHLGGKAADGRRQLEKHRAEPRVLPGLYSQALGDLTKRAQSRGLFVYLLSLPPLAWERIAADQAAWYRRYDDLARQVARSSGVALIDVSGAPAGPGMSYWQEDGVHPSAEGQAWLAKCVGDRLRLDGHQR